MVMQRGSGAEQGRADLDPAIPASGERALECGCGQSRPWMRVVAALVGLVLLGAAASFLPVKAYLVGFLEWAQGLGAWGHLVMGALWIPACVLLLPGSVLTLGTGFLLGLAQGTVTVSIGSVIGASAAFLIGRTVARGWVGRKVAGNARFAAIDRAIGREGWKIVLLARLSPAFPFNLLNYALGLTGVPFRHYVLASWIGMLPGTVLYVYFGTTLRSLAEVAAGKAETGVAGQIILGMGLVATIAATVFITRLAREALRKAAGEAREGTEARP